MTTPTHFTMRLCRSVLCGLVALSAAASGSAQISIDALSGGTYSETFDSFAGAGFAPSPGPGALDSDDFAVSGLSDGDLVFGATGTGGDYARGTDSEGGVGTGGVYAFEIGGDLTLGVQPGGEDFTPGAFYVRFVNDTGSPITSVTVAYDLYVNNDQERISGFGLGYLTSPSPVTDPTGPTYTDAGVPFAYSSPEVSDGDGFVLAASPSGPLAVSIADGDTFVLRFRGDDVSGDGARDEFALDDLSVTFGSGGEQVVTLSASPADGGPIAEATTGSTVMTLTLSTSDGQVTEGAVAGQLSLTQGSNTAPDFTTTVVTSGGSATPTFDEASPIAFSFPAGTADGATLTLTATAVDDAVAEGAEAFEISVTAVSGAVVDGPAFASHIADDDTATDIIINEVRVDQAGSDIDEYAELAGPPGTPLDGLTYLVIGDDAGTIEEVTDLAGQVMPSDGYFLIAEASFSLADSTLDNGDEVDLVTDLDFENEQNSTHLLVSGYTGGGEGTDLDSDDDGTFDAAPPWEDVVSAVGIVDDPLGGVPLFGEALGFDNVGPSGSASPMHVYRVEGAAGDVYMIGTDSGAPSVREDTPGTANLPAVTQSGFADQKGFRLLALPFEGATAADLAEVNLLQGATGQYPDADPNVFVGYTNAGFSPLGSTATEIDPGRGFFLYFFDADADPSDTIAGGGTSRSVDLSGYTLSMAGRPTSGTVSVSFETPNVDATNQGYYMIGNPFAAPLDVAGVTLDAGSTGTLSRTFQVYDGSSYGTVTDGDYLGTYQGVFATVTYTGSPGATGPTFLFDDAHTSPSATPPFHWRRASPLAIGLDLEGEVAGGVTVRDGLADLAFRDGASFGLDAVDAGEIPPPTSARAALALVEDEALRAVRGVPADVSAPFDTRVMFTTSHAGTFTVRFDPTLTAPGGLTATLTDLVTGTTYAVGEEMTFESEATPWDERFVLAVSPEGVATAPEAPELRIGEVYPNPAAGRARLAVEVDAAQRVRVDVIDALGRVVATAFDGDLRAGAERLVGLPDGLAAGSYVVRVAGETFREARRLAVIR